jgi:hypothetical protein
VNEDTLGVEVIAAVMGDSHNFLTQKHTVRYLRAERSNTRAWPNGATGRNGIETGAAAWPNAPRPKRNSCWPSTRCHH